jgi:hypothetical protein
VSLSATCRSLWAQSAFTAISGRARVLRDFSVLVSPWDRTDRHTAALAGTGGLATGSPKSFPPGHVLRYERYGLGMGTNTVEGVEMVGHTGFIGAFAFDAPGYDAVLAGTHNDSQVDRWPLVAALCQELREAA